MKTKSILVMATAIGFSSMIALAADPTTQSSTPVAHKAKVTSKQVPAVKSKKKKGRLNLIDNNYELSNYGIGADSPVTIAPYTSQPTFYSGGQLLVMAPSINEDAKLLYRRLLDTQARAKIHKKPAPNPRLVLSGKVEGQAIYDHSYIGKYTTDIDLTGAEVDFFAELTPWVNALMTMDYDNNPRDNATGVVDSKRRISNSNIYVDKGFITLGDLAKSGFYGSIGQLYVPFGTYASSMVSLSLPWFVGKTRARAITLNYIPTGLKYNFTPYIHAFLFRGDTQYGEHPNTAKNYGFDVGAWGGDNHANAELGMSYIANMADATGEQNNGASSGFRGFEKTAVSNSETLVHNVPGIDFHGDAMYGPFSFLAEYLTAMTSYSAYDMSYNGKGAAPSALNAEAAYAFTWFGKANSIALGYGQTGQALALNVPERRIAATWAFSYFSSTTFSLEFKHDMNYGSGDTASGGHGQTFVIDNNALGKNDNSVKAQIGVYF